MTESEPTRRGLNLHIGGQVRTEGWINFDIVPGETVDVVGSCTDLSMFGDGSCAKVYASHVIEHLSLTEATVCMGEAYRVLEPGGLFYVSVPNAGMLFNLHRRLGPNIVERLRFMQIIFGGNRDEFDFHKFAYDNELLVFFLKRANFPDVRLVKEFGLFDDSSAKRLAGELLSINAIAIR